MKPSSLLVVDDEINNRDILSRRLQRSGYRVATAHDGKTALEMIEQAPSSFDLVLLDQMMPGLTGLDVLRLLRGAYSPERLPVIMVTALNDSDHIVQALDLGANDYVTKPLDFPVVLARVRSQLARSAAEAALRESEQRYALAATGANDGLWDWNVQTGRVYYSPRWKAMLGFSEDEIGGSIDEFLQRVPEPDRTEVWTAIQSHWQTPGGAPYEQEHRMRHKDGTFRWVLCRGAAVHDPLTHAVVRMAGSVTDITERKVFDALTGLPNRLLFDDRLNRALDMAGLTPGQLFALFFIDLDRFKLVNDSLGHVAGDQLLREVAQRLQQVVGGGPLETIARLGGDEFAAIVHGLRSPADAAAIADRILQTLRSPFLIDGKPVFCTASIGIALSDFHYHTAQEFLRDADIAMYSAKAQGKGRSVLFDAAMRDRAVARLELETALQSALESGQFAVFYQPKVHLTSGQIVGFEALIRWLHPERGIIPPIDFISIAEDDGLIVPIGAWVLEESCRQLKAWTVRYPSDRPLTISVNVSPRQFRDPGLVASVRHAIAQAGIEPSQLALELTEGVLFDDLPAAICVLKELRQLGVGLKIDDFGTGYSGLSYLSRLPFDTLKIDRSFTVNLTENDNNGQMIRTILEMAHNLGMQVVAEGIELREQADRLRQLGCEFGQGYYFAKPMPADEAERLLIT
ncbi:MAG: EAL domain-containing protein [Bryobacterales bacterium]|nr:EAL domain-containing protein [Bryobacterales bacterium]